MTINHSHLIWIDLEMTGLNPNEDTIIEIATLVTDDQLNIIAEGPNLAIHQPAAILNRMDAWNTQHHGQSGLIQRVTESRTPLAEAEQQTLDFLRQHLDPHQSPMCGNSICQDRRFLCRLMPTLEAFFHYRNLDVSTVKELAKRWHPTLLRQVKKENQHLALSDIKDSINELKLYKQHFFKQP